MSLTPTVLSPSARQVYQRFAVLALPRHTSYPIVSAWTADAAGSQLRTRIAELAVAGNPISLYVHVPFCERLCFYCACNKEIIPKNVGLQDPRTNYLAQLRLEIELITRDLPDRLRVDEVHLGGGSPTYLGPDDLAQLDDVLRERFAISSTAMKSVEVDPRITSHEHVELLCQRGFNRFSLGVQDFAPKVQEAVNRIQSFDLMTRMVHWLRSAGITSINFDLIYGLPFQTLESMKETLDLVLELQPDRIAFYRLALIPEIFRWQRSFTRKDLPDSDLTLEFFLTAIRKFEEASYLFVGLDHFARATDSLSVALSTNTLQRNFQGMSTGKHLPLLGFGPSAITQLDDLYVQNERSTKSWSAALSKGQLPGSRMFQLNANHRIRRQLIQSLYSYQGFDIAQIEKQFAIKFWDYFFRERPALEELAEHGICSLTTQGLWLSPLLGRLLVRVVAAVFDDFLPPDAYKRGIDAAAASQVG